MKLLAVFRQFGLVFSLATISIAMVGSVVAQEAKPAGDMPKITYEEHVRPIFREHCFSCHNSNSPKGGLSLDSFAKTMEGGSGGQVVMGGDLDSSRLFQLVNHTDEPKMPPMQDKLAA